MNEFPDAWRVAFAVVVGLVAFAAGLWAVNRFVAPAQPVAGYSLDQTIGDIKSELQRLANAPGPPAWP